MDFSGVPGPGAFFFLAAIACAILATLVGIGLKLAGLLLLSWWWVLSPVPALFIGVTFVAGIVALFDK